MSIARHLLLGLLLTGVMGLTHVKAEESHPGLDAESSYAEAVLNFNGKNYSKTIELLDALINTSPANIEALELKALTLKSMGKPEGSVATYEKLLRLKPESERAPYHFELGVILFQQKKGKEAEPHFRSAIAGGFNVGTSQFFLGQIYFEQGSLGEADRAFSAATALPPEELQVAAHYYLGLIHSKSGYASGATYELFAARDGARKLPDNKMAKDIGSAAERALKPYDMAQWFGNISVLGQYDGNVSLLSPTAAPDAASGKSTAKTEIVGGVGRVSSPLSSLQWVASYRVSANKNFNAATRGYEFFTNMPSLYLTVKPLARTSYGFKMDGNYTFQNQVDAATNRATYHPYNLGGEIGPYIRTEVARQTQLTLEIFSRPEKYYQDASAGSDRRSGNALFFRASVKKDTGLRLFNPEASISYESNSALGENYKTRTLELDVANGFKLSGTQNLTFAVAFVRASYPMAATSRTDSTFTLRASWVKELSPKWALIGDGSYTKNTSTQPELYSYNKPVISLGLSYTL